MSVVKRFSLLFALSAAMSAAHAISLGAIELESSLNQPLRATVPLRDVDSDALSGLRVGLASVERFEAAGLIRDDYLRNLRMEVGTDADDRPVVRIRGEGPLREPVLDLLIELRQGRQTVQRGYTLLIDPPEMAREPARDASQSPAAAAASEAAEGAAGPETTPTPAPETAPQAARPAEAAAPAEGGADARAEGRATGQGAADAGADRPAEAPAPTEANEPADAEAPRFFREETPAAERQLDPELLAEIEAGRDRPQPQRSAPPPRRSAEDGVYEVRPGETLWRVAFNTRADGGTDMAQQMLAIVIANPQAFDDGDAKNLLRGARLRIPPPETVRAIDPAQAESTMRALTEGDLRTAAVDPGLMPTSEEAGESDVAGERPAEDAPAAAAREAEADDAQRIEPSRDEAGDDPGTSADPDAAALLVDRALNEAQRRAEQDDATTAEAEDPVAAGSDDEAQIAAGADGADGPEGTDAAGETPIETTADAQDASPAADSAQPTDEGADDGAVAEGASAASGPDLRLLLGIAAVVLLLVALLVWRRRRAAADAAAAEEEEAFTGARGAIETEEPPAAPAAAEPDSAQAEDAPAADAPAASGAGDDPIADADFRIAYGMFDDAAARLQDAVRQEPERADLRLKLAEVHHAAEDREAFLEAADAASGCGLDDEQRRELARMADRIAPDSRHASSGAAAAALGASVAAAGVADNGEAPVADALESGDEAAERQDGATEPAETEGADDDGLNFDLAALESEGGPVAPEEDAPADDPNSLEFDLEQLDDQKSDAAPEPEPAADNLLDFDLDALESDAFAPEAETAEPREDGPDNSLDFDLEGLDLELDDTAGGAEALGSVEGESLDAPEETSTPAAEENLQAPSEQSADEVGLDDFSLADFDLDDTPDSSATEADASHDLSAPAPETTAAPDAPEGDAAEDDFDIGGLELEPEGESAAGAEGAMAGQLDMARAYVDLGDTEAARSMLQEVAERGDAEQQRQAAELLEKLG